MPRETKYIARTIEKNSHIRKTPPPRTILLGGSNVAFGFDSQLLQEELGEPVVNMGLAAGLGIEFMLKEVSSEISTGDIVILSFEYDLFNGGNDFLVIRQVLEMRPESVIFVPWHRWKRLITDFGFHWIGALARRAILSPAKQTAYSLDAWDYLRADFDESNSFVGHHTKRPSFQHQPLNSPIRARSKIRPISPHILQLLTDFAARCHRVGARCLYTCPPQPPELLTSNIDEIERNVNALSGIPYLEVIDSPREQVYSPDELHDTQYHLTKPAATRRTRFVIERLRRGG